MTATEDRPRPDAGRNQIPDPSRSGAVWVAGTGAFLLLAAAALFVAVRWDEIPEPMKLAAVGAMTGGFLLAGRALRGIVPATAGALFHLGAFLVPVDVFAVAVRTGLGGGGVAIAVGAVSTVAFTLAARAEASVVLSWGAGAAVVVLAGGVGASSFVSTPLVLALAAGLALCFGRARLAGGWAGIAGLAPVVGLVLGSVGVPADLLVDIGVAGPVSSLSGLVSGCLAAVVLVLVALRIHDPALALLGAASAMIGVTVTAAALEISSGWLPAGLAALIVLVEVAALVARNDRFWEGPTATAATAMEIVAAPGTLAAAAVLLVAPVVLLTSIPAAVGAGLLGLGWLVADQRRRPVTAGPVGIALLLGGRCAPATLGVLVCVPAALVLATGSGFAGGVALVATSLFLLAGGRPWSGASAAALIVAPLVVLGEETSLLFGASTPTTSPATLLATGCVGLAASVVLARAVAWRRACAPGTGRGAWATWMLATTVPAPLFVAWGSVAGELDAPDPLLVGTVGLAWLVATATGRTPAAATGRPDPAIATRASTLGLVLVASASVSTGHAAAALALACAFVIVDALLADDPPLLLGLAAALPVATASSAVAVGLATPRAGVVLALAAVIVGGLAAVIDPRWQRPLLGVVVGLGALGLGLAAGDRTAAADALLVLGGLIAAGGVWAGGVWVVRDDVVVVGAGAATLGSWVRLAEAGATAGELYVAPVAAVLLLAGHQRRAEAGSWITAGPAIALFGGTALAERLVGGGGGHALVAGTVGVAAVAAGGLWRLASPLVLGTGLLVALAAHESLAVTAGVPTWGWLALGGCTLLGLGVSLEHSQQGPVETGRRVVDAIQDHYR